MPKTDLEKNNSSDIIAFEAMELLDTGDVQAAIKKCYEAISRFGPNRNCYLVKARAHIEIKEYGFAEKALQSALSLDPEHLAAWAMLGQVYYKLGNQRKVDYCRSRLESIFPTLVENLGQVTSNEVEEGEEKEIVEISIEQSTDTIVPFEGLAENENVQVKDNKNGGVGDVNKSLPQAEGGPPTNKRFGLKKELFETATFADICLKQGKFEKARQIYEKLLKDDPENALYREKLSTIESKMGLK
ncbi:MAG: hypothetical protein B6D58_09035 [candidate division Zixibacteria bacterium 4484_95]|nr:MAG: hypothetical protein B6D58_09035 [candidate division Zixibacteria bacterium 4484_95]RKX20758.1 MAG: hypothetical protein DRP26_01020 [candidate division Zixibacteria bacterium]